MQKIKVSIDSIKDKIQEFYHEKIWHFLTINGVLLEENKIEVQWIFSKYEAMDEIIIFYTQINHNDIVPSIVDIIPSAIISQRELVDMFGIDIENSPKGLYLDEDSEQMPLNNCGI